MKRIAIFASGTGSNADQIIRYFKNNETTKIVLVASNKVEAGVLDMAKSNHIETLAFTTVDFKNKDGILMDKLTDLKVDLIVLAGFLLLIPDYLITAYPYKIINIHPALLPKFGGKGMYGINVHKAVIITDEKDSGITIHYVNKQYDEGEIIFQKRCPVLENDTPEELAKRVLKIEHEFFPQAVDFVINNPQKNN